MDISWKYILPVRISTTLNSLSLPARIKPMATVPYKHIRKCLQDVKESQLQIEAEMKNV